MDMAIVAPAASSGVLTSLRCSAAVKGPAHEKDPKWVVYRAIYPKESSAQQKKKPKHCPRSVFDPSFEDIAQEIQDLCDSGQLQKALDVLSRTNPHGSFPSNGMYWTLFKACNKVRALPEAKFVYEHLRTHGSEIYTSLNEYFISTLIRCGDFAGALDVFRKLPFKTAYSWTAVISGYTDSGNFKEALHMYELMLGEGLKPNEYTLASLLKACGSLSNLDRGRELHADARKYGCDTNAFVASTLISMYAKCGCIADAEDVFGPLSEQHNPVNWTSMLSAYVDQGLGEHALLLYRQMLEEGMKADERVSSTALQACCLLGEKEVLEAKKVAFDIGQSLHADIRRDGFQKNMFVCNSLVNMYSKCGETAEAENVFVGLSQCDVVSWNVMLTAYVEQSEAIKALQLYKQMHDEGCTPNQRTFVAALQACTLVEAIELERKLLLLKIGRALHADAKKHDLLSDVYVGSALLGMYRKHGNMVEAEGVFAELPKRNVVSWNAMLSAYVEHGQADNALQLFAQMESEGVLLDDVTLTLVLRACAEARNMEVCKQVHFHGVFAGYESRLLLATNLISAYGSCASMSDACAVFNTEPWRNVLPWNALIAGYAQEGNSSACLKYYNEMQSAGIRPDGTTLAALCSICSPCEPTHFELEVMSKELVV